MRAKKVVLIAALLAVVLVAGACSKVSGFQLALLGIADAEAAAAVAINFAPGITAEDKALFNQDSQVIGSALSAILTEYKSVDTNAVKAGVISTQLQTIITQLKGAQGSATLNAIVASITAVAETILLQIQNPNNTLLIAKSGTKVPAALMSDGMAAAKKHQATVRAMK